MVWYGSFWNGDTFFDNIFCVKKFGVDTDVPIFSSEAGVKRDFVLQ